MTHKNDMKKEKTTKHLTQTHGFRQCQTAEAPVQPLPVEQSSLSTHAGVGRFAL